MGFSDFLMSLPAMFQKCLHVLCFLSTWHLGDRILDHCAQIGFVISRAQRFICSSNRRWLPPFRFVLPAFISVIDIPLWNPSAWSNSPFLKCFYLYGVPCDPYRCFETCQSIYGLPKIFDKCTLPLTGHNDAGCDQFVAAGMTAIEKAPGVSVEDKKLPLHVMPFRWWIRNFFANLMHVCR